MDFLCLKLDAKIGVLTFILNLIIIIIGVMEYSIERSINWRVDDHGHRRYNWGALPDELPIA